MHIPHEAAESMGPSDLATTVVLPPVPTTSCYLSFVFIFSFLTPGVDFSVADIDFLS